MNDGYIDSPGQGLWQSCVDQLAQELPEQQFNTWIRPLVVHVVPDLSKATIHVGNRFKLDWVRAQYAGRISALLEKFTGQKVLLELALAIKEPQGKSTPLVRNFDSHNTVEPSAIGVPEELSGAPFKNRLNTALTFDTLIEGTANRMGRAAALHVSSSLGQLYNPLFIYGGVGLGKTHLMHAIGNKLLSDNPAAKVLYIHAEQFVSDVVKAYQRKTFDEFKERYHSLDLLLIDDVQFFANKDRTQEEFFNAFDPTPSRRINCTSQTVRRGKSSVARRFAPVGVRRRANRSSSNSASAVWAAMMNWASRSARRLPIWPNWRHAAATGSA